MLRIVPQQRHKKKKKVTPVSRTFITRVCAPRLALRSTDGTEAGEGETSLRATFLLQPIHALGRVAAL